MAKAIWEDTVIAESDHTIEVEGNQYFPPESIHKQFFKPNAQQTVCHWKGTAKYFDLEVNGKQNAGAAWYYPAPRAAAEQIKNYVAFWRGVRIEK